MSVTAAALPTLLSAGLTGLSYLAQRKAVNDAAKRQREETARALALTNRYEAKNTGLTMQGAQQYAPTTRNQGLTEAGEKATTELSQYLQAVRPQGTGPGYAGKVSGDYVVESGKREAANAGRARKIAQLMGRLEAPGDLFREEANRNADTATERAVNASDMRGDLRTSGVRFDAIEPSDTLMTLGGLAGAGGMLAAGSVRPGAAGTGMTYKISPGAFGVPGRAVPTLRAPGT